MGIVLNYCQYVVLYLGSYYNTGPYISFPHFGNSNLGKLPYNRDNTPASWRIKWKRTWNMTGKLGLCWAVDGGYQKILHDPKYLIP